MTIDHNDSPHKKDISWFKMKTTIITCNLFYLTLIILKILMIKDESIWFWSSLKFAIFLDGDSTKHAYIKRKKNQFTPSNYLQKSDFQPPNNFDLLCGFECGF